VADNPFLNDQLRAELLAAGVTTAEMARFHSDAGSRRNNIERETKRIVAGFDGTLASGIGDIRYDVFFNYGETNNIVKGQNRQVPRNFEAAVDAITDPDTGEIVCRDPDAAPFDGCAPFNPFGRRNSPEAVAFSFVQTLEEQKLVQQNAGFSLVSDTAAFLTLPAGPIGWAAGFEWRDEETSTDGDAVVQADLTESAAQPDQVGGYKVSEGFLEVSVPLLSDRFLARSLNLDAAYRTADYSHTGSADAWKVGFMWAPIGQVRLRGTLAEAVRAPNITEAFLPASPGFAQVSDPCDVDRINNDPDRAANCAALGLPPGFQANDNVSVDIESSGNRALDPEESRSYTVGIVYEPSWAENLSVTLDYYDIEITDAITLVDSQDIVDNCVDASGGPDDSFCGLFTRDPATQDINFVRSTFVNASKLETQGVDLELRYNKPLSDLTSGTAMGWLSGDLSLSFVGTYLQKLNQFVFQTRPDEIDIERGETGDPIHAYRATAYYKQGDFIVGWKGRYIGSVKRYQVGTDICEDTSPCEADSTIVHDLNVRYFLPSDDTTIELYAGINNVFDEEPPRGLLGTEADEAVYSAIGRNYFVGVRSSF
jgi:outer membrane receptor protein involved in Fe transport